MHTTCERLSDNVPLFELVKLPLLNVSSAAGLLPASRSSVNAAVTSRNGFCASDLVTARKSSSELGRPAAGRVCRHRADAAAHV